MKYKPDFLNFWYILPLRRGRQQRIKIQTHAVCEQLLCKVYEIKCLGQKEHTYKFHLSIIYNPKLIIIICKIVNAKSSTIICACMLLWFLMIKPNFFKS